MKHYFKITSISAATALLSGCLHAPLKPNLAPQQAVTQAYQALYEHPNYRFSGQLRLKRLDLPTDIALTTPMSNDHRFLQKMIQAYSQRYQFNYSGVMDLTHYKISLTPEIRYEAVNMAGYLRVPLLLDLKNSQLYGDLSAFSPWLVPTSNDGKYTRFDGSRYKSRIDFKPLYQLLQETTRVGYMWPDSQDFKELSVSAPERQQGAVRKIQFTTGLNSHIARQGTFLSLNQAMLKQALAGVTDSAKNNLDVSKKPDALPAALIDAQQAYTQMQANGSGSTGGSVSSSDDYNNAYNSLMQVLARKLDDRSRLNQTVLLNAQGRLIQSEVLYTLYFKGAERPKAELQVSHQWQVSDYGNARAADVTQWVDAKQNMQDSLLAGLWKAIKSKRATSLDDSKDSDAQTNKEADKETRKDSLQKDEIDKTSDNDGIENDVLDNDVLDNIESSQTISAPQYALPFAPTHTDSTNHLPALESQSAVENAQGSDAQILLQRGTVVALQQIQAKASDEQVFVNTFVAMALQQNHSQASKQLPSDVAQLREKALKLYAAEPAPDLSQPVDAAAQPTLIYQAIQAAYRIHKQCAGLKQVESCQQQQLKQLKPIE